MQQIRPSQRGFTLVELMVVVAIIALLAAVIIPNYVHARSQAAVSETEANMKQIATALELYNSDNQTYPTKSAVVDPTLFGGTGNPYMNSTPYNAIGHAEYQYVAVPAGAGVPATYILEDAGPYDPTVTASLPKGAGGTTPCGNACTAIYYDPQNGLYGHT